MVVNTLKTLEEYGANTEATRLFSEDNSADLLPYATLLTRDNSDTVRSALLGVYEWQDAPLVFLASGEALDQDPARLTRVRRALALRGDASYLAVIYPGRLSLYHLGLEGTPAESRISPEWADQDTFAILGNQRPGIPEKRRSIVDVVLALVEEAINALVRDHLLPGDEAISLVGRALFTRFLADRKLLPVDMTAKVAFDTCAQTIRTCQWLDDTFNGDALPFDRSRVEALSAEAFQTLGNIMRGAAGGQLELLWQERWARLDFSYIPVAVLSQAYEAYSHSHDPTRQEKEGAYYTPLAIADLMVRGALHPLPAAERSTAKVLDPAAGAGIFLLIAFRHLVAERCRSGTRPNTETLRKIMYGQLTGFDTNEAALRFAALGLYLMAIELDPEPQPVNKLCFSRNLRGTVLHRPGGENDKLGSLGDGIGTEHNNAYDLIVGNPPWPTDTGLQDFKSVKKRVAAIATRRMGEKTEPPLPNEGLDLPFLWRAMEWAKKDGRIVLALHGRLLFSQGDDMPKTRRAIFTALDVIGIINGTELRETNVWPNVRAPFCLLFARNRLPGPEAGLRFITPHTEPALNKSGGWRIDPANADIVLSKEVAEQPALFKTLARGTALDRELLQKLDQHGLLPLGGYWRQLGLKTGNGYQKLQKSSKIGPDGLPGQSTEPVWDLPNLTTRASRALVIDTSSLERFPRMMERVHRARSRSLFQAPLLIVGESPPVHFGRLRTAVTLNDVVFNQSFYGYSAGEYPDGHTLVKYLTLALGSRFALWYFLMTSGRFGIERDTVEKITLDTLPILPFEQISPMQRQKAADLFDRLADGETDEKWHEVDNWIGDLFGLHRRDVQVIHDTLDYGLPYADNRKAAETPIAQQSDIVPFCDELQSALLPWGKRLNRPFRVIPAHRTGRSPWQAVQIVVGDVQPPADSGAANIFRLADRLGMSEVVERDKAGDCVWLARLNQRRYWTRSQARLVMRRLLWEHADFIKGSTAA